MNQTGTRLSVALKQAVAQSPGMPIRDGFIDAMRGLAALAVLLFHSGYLPGGWVGVPVFFALSGYLITRQSMAGVKPRAFWRRRATRLLPLLYLYLAANLIVATVQGHDTAGYGWHFLGLSDAMIANSIASTHGHIGHLWSIAVEIQVYAIWPLIMARSRFRQTILIALGVICLAIWAVFGHPAVMIGTSAAFAVGGIVALRGWHPPRVQCPAFLAATGRAGYSVYIWQMMCIGLAARLGAPMLGIPFALAMGFISARYLEDWRWLTRHPVISPRVTKAAWTPAAVTGTAAGRTTGATP